MQLTTYNTWGIIMAEEKKKERKEKDLDRMTVKELKEVAAESTDLVGIHAMKKAELLAAIKEAKGIKEEKAPKEKIEKKAVTVKELKEKIIVLKAQRKEARKSRDKRMVHILRRKINRLKKETRRISEA
jgi:hypothetical protein